MELQKMIGANVKAARERRKLTLDAAALLTGVSRSMLAQIEKGDVNPTISVLWKIANGALSAAAARVGAACGRRRQVFELPGLPVPGGAAF